MLYIYIHFAHSYDDGNSDRVARCEHTFNRLKRSRVRDPCSFIRRMSNVRDVRLNGIPRTEGWVGPGWCRPGEGVGGGNQSNVRDMYG